MVLYVYCMLLDYYYSQMWVRLYKCSTIAFIVNIIIWYNHIHRCANGMSKTTDVCLGARR